MEITLDGKRVVMRHDGDRNVYVRDLADGKLLQTFDNPNAKISEFAVGADPRLLAVGTGKRIIANLRSQRRQAS